MSFQMSKDAQFGHHLAASHTALSEEQLARQGMAPLSAQGLSHEAMVAKAQYWLTMTQTGREVESWAMLASVASQFCGDVARREELDVAAGDDEALAA